MSPGLYRVIIDDSNGLLEASSLIEPGITDNVEVSIPSNAILKSLVMFPEDRYRLGSGRSKYPLSSGRITLIKAFRISSTEVSNREYRDFVLNTGARRPSNWPASYDSTLDQLPVSGISWDEANQYCRWRGVRLPTPDEWEVASQGPGGSRFPWGEQLHPDIRREESENLDFATYRKYASPVSSDPQWATPSKVGHMLSNVQEYTEGIAEDRNNGLVVKGRSWADSPYIDSSDTRILSSRDLTAVNRGFRIAISVKEKTVVQ